MNQIPSDGRELSVKTAWRLCDLANSEGPRPPTVMTTEQHICQNTDRASQSKTRLTAAGSGVADEGNVIKLHAAEPFDSTDMKPEQKTSCVAAEQPERRQTFSAAEPDGRGLFSTPVGLGRRSKTAPVRPFLLRSLSLWNCLRHQFILTRQTFQKQPTADSTSASVLIPASFPVAGP